MEIENYKELNRSIFIELIEKSFPGASEYFPENVKFELLIT